MKNEQALMQVLTGTTPWRRPVWMMRQAGRYLPEYREVRRQAGSFLDLCYAPELACEVTLQPLRRFDLDAAILFADILLIPQALGSDLKFETNEGPKLSCVRSQSDFDRLGKTGDVDDLSPVFEAVRLIRRSLPDHVSLIGFCGAPWTVATYMVEGGTSSDRATTRLAATLDEAWFNQLIETLVGVSITYLEEQVKAGAQSLQIFDTWAGDLPEHLCQKYCFDPIAAIIGGLRDRGVDVPIIGFARGLGSRHVDFAQAVKCAAIGVEWQMPLANLHSSLAGKVALQGNLDPIALVAGGDHLSRSVESILKAVPKSDHIFNLGHGIRQETPIEHVSNMVEIIRREG